MTKQKVERVHILCTLLFLSYTSPMEIILSHLDETKVFARTIIEELKKKKNQNGATLLLLYGDVGAGKTTLVQFMGQYLGIHTSMQSPTFVIQKNYKTKDFDFKNFVHIDAYRIENPEELKKIKIKETLAEKDTLVVVEWPKQGGDVFAKPHLELFLKFVDENRRKVRMVK